MSLSASTLSPQRGAEDEIHISRVERKLRRQVERERTDLLWPPLLQELRGQTQVQDAHVIHALWPGKRNDIQAPVVHQEVIHSMGFALQPDERASIGSWSQRFPTGSFPRSVIERLGLPITRVIPNELVGPYPFPEQFHGADDRRCDLPVGMPHVEAHDQGIARTQPAALVVVPQSRVAHREPLVLPHLWYYTLAWGDERGRHPKGCFIDLSL